jgi:hypothetical protein
MQPPSSELPDAVLVPLNSDSKTMHVPAEESSLRPQCNQTANSYRLTDPEVVEPFYEPCGNCFDIND